MGRTDGSDRPHALIVAFCAINADLVVGLDALPNTGETALGRTSLCQLGGSPPGSPPGPRGRHRRRQCCLAGILAAEPDRGALRPAGFTRARAAAALCCTRPGKQVAIPPWPDLIRPSGDVGDGNGPGV